ncbi:MAG: TetR/AcrR family transcriptional regulator [Bacteroidota bacterium]|nr:TetR/AcrR family transcriptional regulator [Bacteroidota bacterium]MDP4195906.1 TetR/AcrR family transcriptional regulator [Bacteroidota bacterium]
MRSKDEHKQEAIIRATIKLVNEIGFDYSSVAKIAKEANVSPATIYIYYKNKEDLLVSTYIDIKQKMSRAFLKDFDESKPFRDIFECMWLNGFEYVAKNREYFQFAEQFSNSPYSDLVDHTQLDKHFEPILRVIKKGIEQKVIKNVSFEILSLFVFYPILGLSNPKICGNFELNRENIKQAFTLAWDAIKL